MIGNIHEQDLNRAEPEDVLQQSVGAGGIGDGFCDDLVNLSQTAQGGGDNHAAEGALASIGQGFEVFAAVGVWSRAALRVRTVSRILSAASRAASSLSLSALCGCSDFGSENSGSFVIFDFVF